MDRDEFIITVYCLVCEHYRVIKDTYSLRRGGFVPALSDEEVLTVELCGEYFKLATDKDLFAYFRTHYAHFFPQLTDRTLLSPSCQPLASQSGHPAAVDPGEWTSRRPSADY